MANIYLAGPMRGYKDLNKPAFDRAAAILRDQGHSVFSPSEEEDSSLPVETLLRADLNFIINEADELRVLPGWRQSRGANLEVFVARNLNIPVLTVKGNPIQYGLDLDLSLLYGASDPDLEAVG